MSERVGSQRERGAVNGVLTVARLEFTLRIRAGRWRWMVAAWFLVLLGITALVRTAAGQSNLGFDADTRGAVMFGVVVLVVLALALLVAPALAAQSVNGDRERGTLATLQVTRLRAGEIAVGKLLASWGTALVFLGLTLPLALWCYAEGGLSVLRIVGVYAVTALLLGIVCAISLALSALLARSTTSGVLAYLTVFALTVGTVIAWGLLTAVTQDTVRASNQVCEDYTEGDGNTPPTGTNCRQVSYETTVARPDRTWWLLAPNPFAVLADSAPAGPVRQVRLPDGRTVSEPLEVDVLGGMSRALHQIRVAPREVANPYGTSFEVPAGVTGGSVWPTGLTIDLLLAAGAMWITTRRLRTPTDRLARGQRIA
jgi:ABC-type transport system involved in multi-copper enzyme maturation permease subunit